MWKKKLIHLDNDYEIFNFSIHFCHHYSKYWSRPSSMVLSLEMCHTQKVWFCLKKFESHFEVLHKSWGLPRASRMHLLRVNKTNSLTSSVLKRFVQFLWWCLVRGYLQHKIWLSNSQRLQMPEAQRKSYLVNIFHVWTHTVFIS